MNRQPDRESYVTQTGHERCAVEGVRVGGRYAGKCTIVALRDGTGVALYPHGDEQMRVDLGADAAVALGRFLTREDSP